MVNPSSNGVVVQIDVSNVDFVHVQTFRVDSETVILRGNFHLLALDVQDRMISTMMSEFQFECSPPEREAHNLMTQADTKNRLFSNQSADVFDGIIEGLGIAGAIGEKNPIRLQCQYVGSRRCRWNNRYLGTASCEVPQDVRLDSKVISDDMKRTRLEIRKRREFDEVHFFVGILVWFLDGHRARQIPSDHLRSLLDFFQERRFIVVNQRLPSFWHCSLLYISDRNSAVELRRHQRRTRSTRTVGVVRCNGGS